MFASKCINGFLIEATFVGFRHQFSDARSDRAVSKRFADVTAADLVQTV
jgi:hypothetical protein